MVRILPPSTVPAARGLALAGALAIGWAAPAHAVTYTEVTDAGNTRLTAQVTPAGNLTDIFGSLASITDVDLYVINITDVASFSASTFNTVTSADLDTQLFLLTSTGAPVYLNDDDSSGTSVASTLPAGNSFRPTVAGTYLLGVSFSGYSPVNTANQLLFADGLSFATRGPAFGLQPAVLGGYTDNGLYDNEFVAANRYDIRLTGVGVNATPPVPEPSTYALLLLGAGALGLVGKRRRSEADANRVTA